MTPHLISDFYKDLKFEEIKHLLNNQQLLYQKHQNNKSIVSQPQSEPIKVKTKHKIPVFHIFLLISYNFCLPHLLLINPLLFGQLKLIPLIL